MHNMIIYLIRHKESGKCYVGQTIQKLNERIRHHFKKSAKSCPALAAAIRKYGKESFEVLEVAQASCQDELNQLEQYYITHYNSISPFGYNLEFGGSRGKDSEETKHKRKLALNSPECKAKLSAVSSRTWQSDEYRQNISASRRAMWKTEEYRQKVQQGRNTLENRKRQSALAKQVLTQYAKKRRRPVIATDLTTGIERCYSSATAAEIDGFSQSEISKCCRHPGKYTHRKHAWRFCDAKNN